MLSLKSNLIKLFFALFATVTVIGFQGCGDEEPEAPVITLDGSGNYTASDKSLAGGSIVRFKMSAVKGSTSKSGNITGVKIALRTDGSAAASTIFEAKSLNVASYSVDTAFTIRTTGNTDEFVFTVEDKEGLSATKTVKITIGGDTADPTITLNNAGGAFTNQVTTINVGDMIKYNVTAAKGATGTNIKTFKVEAKLGTNPTQVWEDKTTLNEPSYTYVLEDDAEAADVGTWEITFTTTDQAGKSAQRKVSLIVNNNTGGPSTKYSAKLLGAQNATAGSSLATSNGTVYTMADAKNNASQVDIMYCYGATKFQIFGAPADSDIGAVLSAVTTWSTRNSTKFKMTSMTESNFNSLNGSDAAGAVRAAYEGSTSAEGTSVNKTDSGADSGKVVAFKTQAGKHGIFLIKNITSGANGSATIDVIVEN